MIRGNAAPKRSMVLAGALAGLLSLPLLTGCSPTKRNQILCTLSKDSIPAFNFRELTESARLARDAYGDSARNVETYASRYKVEIFPLPKSAGQVLFLTDTAARRHLVSIRGTEIKLIKSVLTDAQYTKQFDPKLGIFVHTGFQKAVGELYDSISPKLDTSYSVRVTGHSLGGALAVLLTYYLSVDGYKLERTVTFGQPKVTNSDGVRKFRNVSLLRVINGNDPVAYVPPLSYVTAIESPYQHAGGALVLQDKPPYEYVCSEASNVTFVSEFWRDILGKDEKASETLMGNLVYHRDKNYIERLEALDPAAAPATGMVAP